MTMVDNEVLDDIASRVRHQLIAKYGAENLVALYDIGVAVADAMIADGHGLVFGTPEEIANDMVSRIEHRLRARLN